MDGKSFVVYSLEFTLSSQPIKRADDCWSVHVEFGWKHRRRGEWFSVMWCFGREYVLMYCSFPNRSWQTYGGRTSEEDLSHCRHSLHFWERQLGPYSAASYHKVSDGPDCSGLYQSLTSIVFIIMYESYALVLLARRQDDFERATG